jgi:membrane protease YdiL (CAAX protease family)
MSFSAPDEQDAIIEAELAEPPLLARPWGFWMTLLWLLAGYVVLTVTQTIGALPVVLLRMAGRPRPQPEVLFAELVADGLLLAVSTLVCAPAMVAFAVGVVKLTRLPLRDYLGLTSPSPRAVSVSLVAIVAFIAAVDSTYLLMGRPIVPDFMLRAYRTAEFLPALLLALVVAAPVWEEIFFRGLLWRGWACHAAGFALLDRAARSVRVARPGCDLFGRRAAGDDPLANGIRSADDRPARGAEPRGLHRGVRGRRAAGEVGSWTPRGGRPADGAQPGRRTPAAPGTSCPFQLNARA